ncbi:class I SAM-dependent methyltransferase [Desulfobacula toluolica]|uniref:Predicted methyltransferase, type 11 n=1 Tax=Desulfobacula toluolica (strain DSM 7467 / Tol2) TaxID=651182 RepID=K0NMB6_DESTT|nr:class I SAM-dependent methyltransferase [Desulfobacula toluolica]CCK81825.1 predicted methyltransferase, type 11 [Desulfobacula toluolica Tol2]
MNSKISDTVWDILVCPYCGATLEKADQNIMCIHCHSDYKSTESGALDFRLQKKKEYPCKFTLGTPLLPEQGFKFNVLQKNNNPQVDFSDINVPFHLTKELISYFPRAKTDNSLMLDLGCGSTIHREVSEYAGFEYLGLDYESKECQLLGDAHSLPFKDDSFEFILSIAVLEHIRFPFVMMKEAYRVLKPNGIFIGTVAFLEPFHGDSFYHHTHLGTYNSLQAGGFKIEKLCPSAEWSVLTAQANTLFPKMPRFLTNSILMPVNIFHKIWWRIGSFFSKKALEETRIQNTTGAFTFIARKDAM